MLQQITKTTDNSRGSELGLHGQAGAVREAGTGKGSCWGIAKSVQQTVPGWNFAEGREEGNGTKIVVEKQGGVRGTGRRSVVGLGR